MKFKNKMDLSYLLLFVILQSDFLLKRYPVIILDEALKRSLNTDIHTKMLSRIIQERCVSFVVMIRRVICGSLAFKAWEGLLLDSYFCNRS